MQEYFLKKVNKPENYGIAKIKNNQIEKIIEKPKKFISNYAITGLYFFDQQCYQNTQKHLNHPKEVS